MWGVRNLWFYLVVFATNVIQCITGFAGTVLAMPFSIMLEGFNVAKPILNVLGIVASVIIVVQKRTFVDKKELGKIAGIMLAGMVPGVLIVDRFAVSAGPLYKLLGVTVIAFTVLGIVRDYRQSRGAVPRRGRLHSAVLYGLLLLAGVVHGMFVCGGPLLVVYANEKLKDSDSFRATVSAVWILLNTINLLTEMGEGQISHHTVLLLLPSTAVLLIAMLVGNLIYKRMNKKAFMALTYTLMAVSGASLLVK